MRGQKEGLARRPDREKGTRNWKVKEQAQRTIVNGGVRALYREPEQVAEGLAQGGLAAGAQRVRWRFGKLLRRVLKC